MQLNPYVTFTGNCAEAMTFYQSIFGGELEMASFRDFGMDADGIMHSSLAAPGGINLFASDHAEGMWDLKIGNNIQVSISGDEEATLTDYWNGLAEGGQQVVALETQPWGALYGQVIDKFGIAWHVNIAQAS